MLACNIDVSAEPALRGLVRKYVVLTSNATGTPIKVHNCCCAVQQLCAPLRSFMLQLLCNSVTV